MIGPIASKRRMRSASGPRTASKKYNHLKRAAAARVVMAGYPIKTKFAEPEDVSDYLNADRITCLRCGKAYKALTGHLRVHGWTAEKYKEFYGLPQKKGLVSSGTRALHRRETLKSIERGVLVLIDADKGQIWRREIRGRRNSSYPYLRSGRARNLAKSGKKDPAQVASGKFLTWREQDYKRVLDRMKAGDKTLAEACAADDLPTVCAVHVYARKHAKFQRALDTAHEELSFAAQLRGYRLGQRLRREGAALRLAGLTCKQIARRLGNLNPSTVKKHLRGAPYPAKSAGLDHA